MDRSFWIDAWKNGRTRFHRADANPDLLAYEAQFLGGGQHRVLVPLCGKSVDLVWLAERGHDVVGVELSELAARAVFEESGREYAVRDAGGLKVFASPGLSVINADLFDVTPHHVGSVDRIWDRAALVALPPEVRGRYVMQLRGLAGPNTVVLLNAIEYDPSVMDGPPFSVPEAEVRAHYEAAHVEILRQADVVADEPRWAEAGHSWWLDTSYLIRFSG